MRLLHLPALLILATLAAAPAFANLVEKAFPGKSEDAVAAEFEAGVAEYLAARLKDPTKPRAYLLEGKHEVFVELITEKEGEGTWQALVPYAWYPEKVEYAYAPFGKEFKLKHAEVPPRSVAGWYDPTRCTPQQAVGLAAWLATKEALMVANAFLAGFAEAKKDFKPDVDAWLCEKNAWTLPEGGLESVPTLDLNTGEAGFLYLTKEAKTEYMKELEDSAKDDFKDLEDRQGGDLKSKPGYRKKSPTMRLDMLEKRIERYQLAYAETDFIKKKGTQKDLEAMLEAVKGDQEFIATAKFKAERQGIDGDWPAAARSYGDLLRLDPMNPDLLTISAEAYQKAAEISDAGLKAADPKAAAQAASMYERLIEIFPRALAYHNFAGLNWLAAGDKKKAKMHHEVVIARTDNRADLTENEKKNREYAETQLKVAK